MMVHHVLLDAAIMCSFKWTDVMLWIICILLMIVYWWLRLLFVVVTWTLNLIG